MQPEGNDHETETSKLQRKTVSDALKIPRSVLIEESCSRIKPMQQAISALIGGLITALVVTPLEVIKTRVQTQHAVRQQSTVSKLCYVFHNGLMTHICKTNAKACVPKSEAINSPNVRPVRGAMDACLKILCSNGITGLWTGLCPTLVSALPSTIIYFLTYEYMKYSFANLYYVSRQSSLSPNADTNIRVDQDSLSDRNLLSRGTAPYIVPMASGICARTVVVTAITPIEMVRIKMQSGYITYAELWLVLRSLIRSDGVLGLWRGWPPTVMRDAPFSGTYWASYEFMKRTFNITEPTFCFSFITGAACGALATWVTMPFDLITTHTQIELGQDMLYSGADSHDPQKRATINGNAAKTRQSVLQRLGLIYREQGIRGLYIGIMPRMLRVMPACAIMISTFEYSKSFFIHYNHDLQRKKTGVYR